MSVPAAVRRSVAVVAMAVGPIACGPGDDPAAHPTGATPVTGPAVHPTVATVAPTVPGPPATPPAATAATVPPARPPTTPAAGPTSAAPPTTIAPASTTPASTTPVGTAPPTTTVPLRAACEAVVQIGDSTGVGLDTLAAELAGVGVATLYPDSSPGRSMVERLGQQRTAVEVAGAVVADGFEGCWVLLVGTNDAANVAAGAPTGLDARIDRMMAVIGGAPVLWVGVASATDQPYYTPTDLQAFNEALERAADRHANLRVYDWAAEVRPEWYAGDGLHYSADGSVWRAALIARALARAFPAP